MNIKLQISKQLKIGIFTLIILVALFFLINYLKGRDLFGKTNLYFAEYDNVEGLTTTGPVFIKGLRVGFVEKIRFNQDNNLFLVTLSVKSGYKIPKNSIAEIYSSDILGTKSIRIELGDSKDYLTEKDTLKASLQPSLITMLTGELIPLKDKAERLIESMEKTFSGINDVLDDDTKKDIKQTLNKLNATVENIQSITGDIEKSSPKIAPIVDNIGRLTQSLNSNSAKLEKGLDNINTITDSLKKADIAGTVNSLKSLLIKIEDPNGSVGKLFASDSIHTQINNLLIELDKLIKNINENPKKYIKVSVF